MARGPTFRNGRSPASPASTSGSGTHAAAAAQRGAHAGNGSKAPAGARAGGSDDSGSGTVQFLVSSEVSTQVTVRVDRLKGVFDGALDQQANTFAEVVGTSRATKGPQLRQYYVQAALYYQGGVICQPVSTRFTPATMDADGSSTCVWDETLSFCAKYKDLPQETMLALTVWPSDAERPSSAAGEPSGPEGALAGCATKLFSKKLRLRAGCKCLRLWQGRQADGNFPSTTPGKIQTSERGEAGRLERLAKHHRRGGGAHGATGRLDRMCLDKVASILAEEEVDLARSGALCLHAELPQFPFPVFFQEPASAMSHTSASHLGSLQGAESPPQMHQPGSVVLLSDPEIGRENPAERKAQRLARTAGDPATSMLADKNLKPNNAEKRAIEAVLRQPPTQVIGRDARRLLWRFRYSLKENERALTKFLLVVDWGLAHEVQEALVLMASWAPISTADALCLLSSDFPNTHVRAYAVRVLETADDEEIVGYLLQLVQALRYESSHESSPLAGFLIARACQNQTLGNFLHWYLYVEWQDPAYGLQYAQIHERFVNALLTDDAGYGLWDDIRRQIELVTQLGAVKRELGALRTAARKKDRLHELLSESGLCGELASLRLPLPLDPAVLLTGIIPEESTVFKSALTPLRLTFRTAAGGSASDLAAQASSLSLDTEEQRAEDEPRGGKYAIIFKKGDDLRQDQLVVQMIQLMDRLLKKDGLDLRLTPYKVLATASGRDVGDAAGLVECVPNCLAVSEVLEKFRDIRLFLAQHNPDAGRPFARDEVLQTFVKSCAGNCVITYILGVGDRHLDNLMLTEDGRLFHIDFGYILGKDPKPFPPPMKLCKEMVEAMGGSNSASYRQFQTYCCEAYNILRKSANLILSLFHLMEGARIPDISDDPEKAMLKLQEKFRLDLSDEEAMGWMQKLINDSASALMPQVMETAHRWATYWR